MNMFLKSVGLYKLSLFFAAVALSMIFCLPITAETEAKEKDVLYISSYHEGYKWSDDIRSTIEALFFNSKMQINMDTYYMDTQRIPITSPEDYYGTLARTLSYRNQFRNYDLIITSDDAAYDFMVGYGKIFDQSIPHLYCGVGDPEVKSYDSEREIGGVVEYTDYKATIEAIGQMQPEVKTIYYIIDGSLTGQYMEEQLLDVTKNFEDTYEFISMRGLSIDEIMDKVAELGPTSAVLYTIMFYDGENNYHEYDESIQLISKASTVPIYGVQEFNLNNGIIGGKLTEGVDHGRAIADMALSYFEDKDYEFIISDENLNTYNFDYKQLVRFNMPLSQLPEGANVVNYFNNYEKNVLILHSYNHGFQWTDYIDQGIRTALAAYGDDVQIFTEYMDLKSANDILYQYSYQCTFQKKYGGKKFDLIITSDDGAFEFAKDYIQAKFGNAPIVFSGVNYLSEEDLMKPQNYTGVMEAYDVSGTIDAMIALQPELKKIYVINDNTVTGIGNMKNVVKAEGDYEDQLDFEYSEDLTMTALLDKVRTFDEDTAILLMSFNRDKESNNYSYAQSIRLIQDISPVPLYGVWDFYLGQGIVGGYLTDGHEQGEIAGQMGVDLLNGKGFGELPIVTTSPNQYMFDMNQLQKFGLNDKLLPKGAIVINRSKTFKDAYNENKQLFNIVFGLLISTVIVMVILMFTLRYALRMFRRTERLATYDHLTGIFNRGTGIKRLEDYMTDSKNIGNEVTIVFMDMNGLKEVNDKYGHSEGDEFIVAVVEVIRLQLEDRDILCRMGGDEFMAILTEKSEEQSAVFKDNVVKALDQRSQDEAKPYRYSVSIGMNHLTVQSGMDLNMVIEEADTLMYKEKAIHRMRKNK